jgi:hypothetical protein
VLRHDQNKLPAAHDARRPCIEETGFEALSTKEVIWWVEPQQRATIAACVAAKPVPAKAKAKDRT